MDSTIACISIKHGRLTGIRYPLLVFEVKAQGHNGHTSVNMMVLKLLSIFSSNLARVAHDDGLIPIDFQGKRSKVKYQLPS